MKLCNTCKSNSLECVSDNMDMSLDAGNTGSRVLSCPAWCRDPMLLLRSLTHLVCLVSTQCVDQLTSLGMICVLNAGKA